MKQHVCGIRDERGQEHQEKAEIPEVWFHEAEAAEEVRSQVLKDVPCLASSYVLLSWFQSGC